VAARPRLSRFELQIMEALWTGGPRSIREIQQSLPAKGRPAYTTVQTMVYRLEGKGAVERVKKISNAHIFAPLLSRDSAQRRLLDEILGLFGGRAQPLMNQLIEAGKLSASDIEEAEKTLRRLAKKNREGS
jgi:BlaI family transcriptional regulator, penicillinase repressor